MNRSPVIRPYNGKDREAVLALFRLNMPHLYLMTMSPGTHSQKTQ